MSFILALDQGTTSSRALVFDPQLRVVGSAQQEFTQHYPQPGWVEHDPDEIWETQHAVALQALGSAGLAARQLAAIGVTNQRETTVLWDRATGRPIHRAIVWQDRRTAELCEHWRARGFEPLVHERTGLRLDPYFSASKILWLLEHVPGARELAAQNRLAFGTIDTWLAHKLTGGAVHVTDVSNASRTMLLSLRTGAWCEQLLNDFGIPGSILPNIVPSSGVVGMTACPGFDVPVPIAGIAGDQQAALFGQSAFSTGIAKCTYGTGCFMLMNIGASPRMSGNRLLTTAAWRINHTTTYALEGSVFVGGAVVQWLRDGLKLIKTSADIEALARQAPDNGGLYLVPAFSGLGAPHWDPYARGAMLGISRGTTAAHLARAALESIAFQVADLFEVMQSDAGGAISELRVDGGAAGNDLLLQFQADLLRVPVVRPANTETTSAGAAALAGLGVGLWKGIDELRESWSAKRVFRPLMPETRAATLRQQWKRAVERALRWERA